jgi:hypothetical protein
VYLVRKKDIDTVGTLWFLDMLDIATGQWKIQIGQQHVSPYRYNKAGIFTACLV